MLMEERDRDRFQKQSAVESAESNISKTATERDASLAKAIDYEQQLTAALADLKLARSDTERVMTANINLQNALEAFQSEREAEIGILEEQRVAVEEATAAAHAAAIEATHEANEAQMRALQMAADAAVTNVMEEVRSLEGKVEVSDFCHNVALCYLTTTFVLYCICIYADVHRNFAKKMRSCGDLSTRRSTVFKRIRKT